MDGKLFSLAAAFVLAVSGTLSASHKEIADSSLADSGIEVGIGVTNIYQQNVHGGISTHRRAGRFSGSYDAEITADMQKLAGLKGGSLYIHGEGVWPKSGKGIVGLLIKELLRN